LFSALSTLFGCGNQHIDQTNKLRFLFGRHSTNKRISVIFRGSVFGGEDWFPTNINAIYEKLDPTPEVVSAKLSDNIKVHRGFNSELLLLSMSRTCYHRVLLIDFFVSQKQTTSSRSQEENAKS
jgi:hypothetical protein